MNTDELKNVPTSAASTVWANRIAQNRLRLSVVEPNDKPITGQELRRIEQTLSDLLSEGDEWAIVTSGEISGFDAVAVWRPCGDAIVAAAIVDSGTPAFPLSPQRCFHPFHASFEREIEARGGVLLAAHSHTEIEGSIQALRAHKLLHSARLLVVDDCIGQTRGEQIASFAAGLKTKTGIEVVHRGVPELRERAAAYSAEHVESEWKRLQNEVFNQSDELESEKWRAHLLQVTRLYLALRELLHETGACGVTVADIQSFLLPYNGQFPEGVMPNVAYGALVDDGFLACEEADIEVLASELLLAAASGQHPTMSNIYLAYRDCFDALDGERAYKAKLEHADFEQCRHENILVAAHFSTSGVLATDMRLEERATIRETLPSWRGQCMVAATPKTGAVRLSRLSRDGKSVHHLPGEVVKAQMDDSKGWYRGRWLIEIESVNDFIKNCQHQHYAIGPCDNDSAQTTWTMLLRLCELPSIV